MANATQINSIARAAEILKYLSHGVSKLTEISRRLDVNKASVHRIMKTLENKGLVSQDPSTRRYFLGPLVQTLAANPMTVHQILSRLAYPELERLRNLTGETVVLQIRMGAQRLILEMLTSHQTIQYYPENIQTAPIHAGAGSKILLAELDKVYLEGLLNRLNLTKLGPNTITDKDKLKSDLETIRSQGYAVSFGEAVEGGAGIAVPVKNYSCPAALVVIGPEERIRGAKDLIVEELKRSAAIVSERIAHVTGIKMAVE